MHLQLQIQGVNYHPWCLVIEYIMVEEKCQQYGQINAGLQASLQRITLLNGVCLSKELGKQLDKLNTSRQGLRRGAFTGIHGVKSVCAEQINVYTLINFFRCLFNMYRFIFYFLFYHCIYKYFNPFHLIILDFFFFFFFGYAFFFLIVCSLLISNVSLY